MIKPNELRIGNLLMYSDNSGIWKVSGIHEFGIDCFDDIEETYMEYENFEGIPLTEEWLVKFGFIKDLGLTYGLDKLNISLTGVQYDFGRTYFNSWCILERQPEFVHQLQNLYFALIGKELQQTNN